MQSVTAAECWETRNRVDMVTIGCSTVMPYCLVGTQGSCKSRTANRPFSAFSNRHVDCKVGSAFLRSLISSTFYFFLSTCFCSGIACNCQLVHFLPRHATQSAVATASRSSICLSVCDVEVSWSHVRILLKLYPG